MNDFDKLIDGIELRRSDRAALRWPRSRFVMDEMGHTDPALALKAYRQSMRRDEGEKRPLRELVEGVESAVIGSRADLAAEAAPLRRTA